MPVAGLTGVLPSGPVYLHLDVDVVDRDELPGLRYPAPDGPGLADVIAAVRVAPGSCDVVAVGLACTWHPGAGGDRVIAGLAEELVAC